MMEKLRGLKAAGYVFWINHFTMNQQQVMQELSPPEWNSRLLVPLNVSNIDVIYIFLSLTDRQLRSRETLTLCETKEGSSDSLMSSIRTGVRLLVLDLRTFTRLYDSFTNYTEKIKIS